MKRGSSRRPRWLTWLGQDLRVFVRLFPWRIFAILVLGTGVLAYLFYHSYNGLAGDEELSYVQALFSIIKMVQFDYDLPAPARVDPFLWLVPGLGLPFLLLFGVNILTVLQVFFVRAERGQMWQVALASTIEEHVLICGLGRVGYRLARQMLDLGIPVVGINDVPSPLVQALVEEGMPLIIGDARRPEVLKQAGVTRAATVIVATNRDLINIEAAFHVRELNPTARVVLRFFEDEFAPALQRSLGVDAVISRSAVAAVAFAHAVVGVEIAEAFSIMGQTYVLARVRIDDSSPLLGQAIARVAEEEGVTVVFHCRTEGLTIEPEFETLLEREDEIFIFAVADRMEPLIRKGLFARINAPLSGQPPVLVCGLGHTGYRVVSTLLELGQQVVALDLDPGRLAERLTAQGVRVIRGDFRQGSVLREAGIQRAAGLVACTSDDMTNLETALRARALNPEARLVIRFFEEELGERLRVSFGLNAVYSTSALANPAFLAAALEANIAQPVSVGERDFFLTRFTVQALSRLVDVTCGELDAEEGVIAVLHAHRGEIEIPPRPESRLGIGDEIVVLASRERLRDLSRRNHSLRRVLN